MNVGQIKASLGLDWSDMRQSMERAQSKIKEYDQTVRTELRQAEQRFSKFAGEVRSTMARVNGPLSTFRNRMGSLGPAIAGAGGAFAAVGFIKKMADFERSLSAVEVVSQATAEQMDKMRDSAKKMGATTEFAASQAADAQKYLAMAGLDVEQTLGTLPKMLNLATAGQLDLANAADISTNIMSQFSMEVEELTDVNDALVAVQSTANTNIEEAANALTYAGAKAKSFNMDIEDSVSLIGMLANNGIKASKAGTTLRQGMQKLLAPTGETAEILDKYNINVKKADGSMRNFVDILKQMADAGIDTTEMAEMLGARASNLTLIMNNGSKAIEDYNQEIRDMEGISKSAAETIRNDMQGAIDKLQSRIESVGIFIWEEYKKTIKNATEDAAKWLSDHRADIADTFDKIVQKGKELKNAGLPAIKGITDALQSLVGVYNSLPSAVTGPGSAGLVGLMLFGKYGAAAFSGLAIAGEIKDLYNTMTANVTGDYAENYTSHMEALKGKTELLQKKIENLRSIMQLPLNDTIMENLRNRVKEAQEELDTYEGKLQLVRSNREGRSRENEMTNYPAFMQDKPQMATMSKEYRDAFNKAKNAVDSSELALANYMDTIKSWQSLVQVSNKLQEESATKFEDTKDAIQDKIKQVKMSEEEYAKYQAIQKLASNATEEQKEAVRKLVDKLYDLRKAQDEANEETKDEIDPVREVTERMRDKRNELIMSEERYAKYKAVKKADIALDSEAAKKIREKIDAYYDLKRAQQSQQDSKDISLEFENVKSKTDNIWQEMKMGGRSMFQDLEKSANNWAKNTKQIMQSTTGAMSDALTDFIMTGEMKWKDFTQTVVKQITQIMMQYLMLQAIKTAAGIPGMPSISSASAQGNVFSDGKVQPFAKGGVVDQPTVFPMANGAGLMGEKGPEAVMPLTRTSGGDLGVKTEEGGGKKVQQNFNIQVQTGPDGKIAQESQQQMSRKLFRTMKNAERRN